MSGLIRSGLLVAALVGLAPGCGPKDYGVPLPGDPPPGREGGAGADVAIQEALNGVVNEAEIRYKPLRYEYDEGLLKIADRSEAAVSGKASGDPPRFMPGLDEAEERDHFRETIRRWEAKNGRSFRAAIDPLIAEVAARKPGESFHPDFHKRFGLVFDSFVPIEVKEARERQNRAIRTRAEAVLAPHRATQPDLVAQAEAMLGQQYPTVSGPPTTP